MLRFGFMNNSFMMYLVKHNLDQHRIKQYFCVNIKKILKLIVNCQSVK